MTSGMKKLALFAVSQETQLRKLAPTDRAEILRAAAPYLPPDLSQLAVDTAGMIQQTEQCQLNLFSHLQSSLSGHSGN